MFVLVLGCWQLPFLLKVGYAGIAPIWSEGGELGQRFHFPSWRHALTRWGVYPVEVIGSTLPWSLMLLVLPMRWFRAAIGNARPMFAFLLTALAVTFPTCWLPADSRARYFMALYPCLALLIGLAIERCWQSSRDTFWRRSWDRYLTLGVGIVLLAGIVITAARWPGIASLKDLREAISPASVLLYLAAAVAASAALFWSRRGSGLARGQLGVVAIAGFIGLTNTLVVIGLQTRKNNDPRDTIASVRELIPPGEQLLSFGPVHHLFAYYYGQAIELGAVTETGSAPIDFSNTYFCYVDDPFFTTPEIPFEWDRVAEISCERSRTKHPLTKVVVGTRRTPAKPRDVVQPASGTMPAGDISDAAIQAAYQAAPPGRK